jgi:SAM-dependent methyltransferase
MNDTVRVVDVGCGQRPYEHLFAGYDCEYLGVDWEHRPGVDLVASGDDLPIESASIDVVICSQVLEHVENPNAVVKEMHRVLKPGGLALVSTHGLMRYHPNPHDYWRWTHAGLYRMFCTNGCWERIDVIPNGSTVIAIAYLVQYESAMVARRLGIGRPWRIMTAMGNVVAWQGERLYRRAGGKRVPSLSANYLVSATSGCDASNSSVTTL